MQFIKEFEIRYNINEYDDDLGKRESWESIWIVFGWNKPWPLFYTGYYDGPYWGFNLGFVTVAGYHGINWLR